MDLLVSSLNMGDVFTNKSGERVKVLFSPQEGKIKNEKTKEEKRGLICTLAKIDKPTAPGARTFELCSGFFFFTEEGKINLGDVSNYTPK